VGLTALGTITGKSPGNRKSYVWENGREVNPLKNRRGFLLRWTLMWDAEGSVSPAIERKGNWGKSPSKGFLHEINQKTKKIKWEGSETR